MFSIYGRSKVIAKKLIDKELENINGDLSKELNKYSLTQNEKQKILDDAIDKKFIDMSIKRCTQEFSAPEFARECLAMMQKDDCFSHLKLMMKQPKLLKSGKKSTSKTTGKTLMAWVDYN